MARRDKSIVVRVDDRERQDLALYAETTGTSVSEAMRNGAFLYYETLGASATSQAAVTPSSPTANTMQALYRDGQSFSAGPPAADGGRLSDLEAKVRKLERNINASMRKVGR